MKKHWNSYLKAKSNTTTMNKVEQILSKIQEDLYELSNEEQNELVVTIIKGIQAKRRSDIDHLEEQAASVKLNFEKLKEELCNASNLMKS